MMPPQIRKLRQDLGFTQMNMALVLNTTPRTVANWEAGKTQPDKLTKSILRAIDVLCRMNGRDPKRSGKSILTAWSEDQDNGIIKWLTHLSF